MADPNEWDNREMFERFLYDYLRKKNMHQTAETFRKETNLRIDPDNPIPIDVPDGFLCEWWSVFFDTYFARQPNTSITVEQMMKTRAQNLPLPGQYEMNEQTLRHLDISAGHGLTMGNNLLPWMGRLSTEIPQGLSSSQYQPELLSIVHPPQEAGSSAHATLRMENVAPDESSRMDKSPSDSEVGSSNMPGFTNLPTEASSSSSSSSSVPNPTSPQADSSIVHEVEEIPKE